MEWITCPTFCFGSYKYQHTILDAHSCHNTANIKQLLVVLKDKNPCGAPSPLSRSQSSPAHL